MATPSASIAWKNAAYIASSVRLASSKFTTSPAASPQTMPNSVPTTGNDHDEPGRMAGIAHQRRQVTGPCHQLDVHVAVELVERGEPGGGRHRIAGQRPRVEHRAERRQVLHHIDPTTDRADRQTTADHLAEAGQIGLHVVLRLGAARPDPESGDHLVEDEQRADTVALGPQTVEEARRWRDDAHVRRDRLDDDRRDLLVEHGHDVVRHDHRLGHGTARHAGGARQTRASRHRCHRRRAARRWHRGSCRRTSRCGRGPSRPGRAEPPCSWPRYPSSSAAPVRNSAPAR